MIIAQRLFVLNGHINTQFIQFISCVKRWSVLLVSDKPKGLCKYGEDCNFAFNQLEIDVWTEERNGRLDRKRLFETAALKMDPVNNIKHLLQDHSGAYTFLCQVGALAL